MSVPRLVPAGHGERPGVRWVAPLLALLAVAPFVPTLGFGYIYDDTTIIRSNPSIRGWSSLLHVWTQPYWVPSAGGPDQSGLYRPLLMTVFAAIWNGIGHAPFWFHILVVGFHVAVTLAVWLLVARAVGAWAAALAAAWFAVQPVHVEAVANIANGSEVMVALCTALLALQLARLDSRAPHVVDWTEALSIGFLYAAACLIKESGVVAIAIGAVWGWGWRAPRSNSAPAEPSSWRGAVARWWRVGAVCIATLLGVTLARVAVLGAALAGSSIAAPGLGVLSPVQRVWAMLSLGPRIAALLVWPATLNPHYGPPVIAGRSGPTAAAFATILVLAALVYAGVMRARRGDKRLLAAVAWTTIAFFPASNLAAATGQILAERTLYTTSIGVAMLAALVLSAARVEALSAWRANRRLVRAAGVAVTAAVVALVVATAVRTERFTRIWSSHPALFRQMIAADSLDYRGYWMLGLRERDYGSADSSLALLHRAYALYPRDRQLLIDYSEMLMRAGHAAQASVIAGRLLAQPGLLRRPAAVALYLNASGRAYGVDSVIARGRRLLNTAPTPTSALFVGAAYEIKRDSASAIAVYREALRVSPGDSLLSTRLALLSRSSSR